MKFLIIFALAFPTVLAKDLHSRLIKNPVLENEGRITRGQIATPGQFKYQAGLSMNVFSTTVWCGGSLISKNWILTAASCTNAASSGTVYLGSTKRLGTDTVHNISKSDLFTHKSWEAANLAHDISLIRIPTTAESSKIGFVKIPSNDNNKYVGDSAVVTGWGRTSDEATGLSTDLQYAILKVSPGNICFGRYALAFVDEFQICVATPNKVSTCDGDHGGPLVLEASNLQIGVDSYRGSKGCTDTAPLIFTRVSAYIFWIKETTEGITK